MHRRCEIASRSHLGFSLFRNFVRFAVNYLDIDGDVDNIDHCATDENNTYCSDRSLCIYHLLSFLAYICLSYFI